MRAERSRAAQVAQGPDVVVGTPRKLRAQAAPVLAVQEPLPHL